jgi:hypothetical protein
MKNIGLRSLVHLRRVVLSWKITGKKGKQKKETRQYPFILKARLEYLNL